MGESTAGNAHWKRGEQWAGWNRVVEEALVLASEQAPTPRKVAYCTRSRVLDRVGWLPRKVRGEHGRIVIFCFDRVR
jgi:hypothetical protein